MCVISTTCERMMALLSPKEPFSSGISSSSSLVRMKSRGVNLLYTPATFFLFLNIYLFIYLWLRWVFVAVHWLSLVAVSGGYSSLWCAGFSLQWLLLLRSMGSRRAGFSSCGTWAQ